MTEPNSQNEKPKDQRRFSQEQYEMLKGCSDKKDMTKWNEWREEHPEEDVWLQERDFSGWWLKKANFMHGTFYDSQTKREINYSGEVHLEDSTFKEANVEEATFSRARLEGTRFQHAKARGASFCSAHLENAILSVAHLEDCNFRQALLQNANLVSSFLIGAKFYESQISGCCVLCSVVDGASKFWECQRINRYTRNERFTDFSGTPLANIIIDPGTRQLLEYNVRRRNWEEWYPEQNRVLVWLVRKFWQISDYGISTKRIIWTFFKWALLFAAVYYLWGFIDYYFVGVEDHPGIVTDLFVLADGQLPVSFWLVPFRAIYFSIVTMTTLGFGDMYANAHSLVRGLFGHALLALQVILGYVLMGALVTRFAVLFTAGGPAGKFADEK